MSSRFTAAPRAVKIGYTCAKFSMGTSPSERNAAPSPASPQAGTDEACRNSDDSGLSSDHLPGQQPQNQGEERYNDQVDGTENGYLV